jgi:hypothetical protein
MASTSGTRAPGARRCGQAADRQWAGARARYMAAPCDFPESDVKRGSVDVVSRQLPL